MREESISMKLTAAQVLSVCLLSLTLVGVALWYSQTRPKVAGLSSQSKTHTQAIVVPHHGVGTALITQAVEMALENRPHVAGIVIISPDHYAREDIFVTSATRLEELKIDDQVVDNLVDALPFVVIDNQKLSAEHGILIPAKVVASYYPDTIILPLAIAPHYKSEQFERLVEELAALGQDWLFVMSTDFSHNLLTEPAFQNHQLMIEVLTGFDYYTLDQLNDEYTDARVPLQVLMQVMEQLDAKLWETWGQGHSAQYLGLPYNQGTSYVIGQYARPTDNLVYD